VQERDENTDLKHVHKLSVKSLAQHVSERESHVEDLTLVLGYKEGYSDTPAGVLVHRIEHDSIRAEFRLRGLVFLRLADIAIETAHAVEDLFHSHNFSDVTSKVLLEAFWVGKMFCDVLE